MIKKLLLAVALALPMTIAAQAPKFGVLNSQEIMMAMPETQTMQNTLKDAQTKFETEGQKIVDQIKKQEEELQKLDADASTPQAIKDRKVEDYQNSVQKYQTFAQTAQQELQRQQQQLLAPIQAKFDKAVQTVGIEGGFTFIYDLAIPSLLHYGDAAQDVSPLVKAKLGIK